MQGVYNNLDLMLLYNYSDVAILKLTDDDRLANVRITIADSNVQFADPPSDVICSYIPGQPSGAVFEMLCNEVMQGRYVRVTAVKINNKLNLYEIEIYGWE